jgi:hypothetical protein
MFRYVALAWSNDSELEKATVEMLNRQMTSSALPWTRVSLILAEVDDERMHADGVTVRLV